MQGEIRPNGIWAASGGSGDRLVVLLHGVATNALVFSLVVPFLEASGWRWIAPDFRGHGRSVSDGPFGFGNHAADISEILVGEDMAATTVLGHSFGGVVGALLCSGLFGPTPARFVAYGTKVDWTQTEIEGAHEVAAKRGKVYKTREEAAARYLKVSGLIGLIDREVPEVDHGIVTLEVGFALAADPRVFTAVGPSVDTIFSQVSAPMRLALGENDRIATLDALRRHDPQTIMIPGVGHNVQTEAPEEVVALLD